MNVLEKWSTENSQKKSAVMVIDNEKGCMDNIRVCPIKLSYKYIEFTLDNKLSPLFSFNTAKTN